MNLIDSDMTSSQLYAFLRYKNATDEQTIQMKQLMERWVLQYRPDAKLLMTCDKQGRIQSAAIYDSPLLLNHLGQFRPLQQHAPQRISKKVECKATHHAALRFKLEFDLWLDALMFVARNTPELARELRAEVDKHTVN